MQLGRKSLLITLIKQLHGRYEVIGQTTELEVSSHWTGKEI